MKVLYVEDDENCAYMMSQRLTRAGFTVIVATDGAQGLALAMSEQPDLILMDLSVPVVDGWQATRQLKADPATKHIPIVAITANVMVGDREKAMAAGSDEFDIKPVDLPRLLGKITAVMSHASSVSAPARAP